MDPIKQLENRIAQLERTIDQMKSANSFPFEIDKALEERGFSKTQFFMGLASIAVGGYTKIAVPGANAESSVVATISSTSPTLDPITASMVFENGTYMVYVEGTATTDFNYIVCLNAPSRS
jgi:hypothetical protein